MTTITRRIEFDAGHRVPGHGGKCRNVHGHRYRLEVTVDGEVPEDGMILDFGIVKAVLVERVVDRLDHRMLVWRHDVDLLQVMTEGEFGVVLMEAPPTAENLAVDIALSIDDALSAHGVQLVAVRLYETPNSWADWGR